MFINIMVVALIGIMSQESEARPSISVIIEYTPKLFNESMKLVRTIAHGNANISRSQDFIDGLVDNAQMAVNLQLTDLNEQVSKAQAKAEQAQINITDCVTEELSSIENINFTALDQCSAPPSIRDLYQALLKLAKDSVAFTVSSSMCIAKHPFNGSKLAVCFDEVIQKAEDNIIKCNSIIENALMTVKHNSLKCIETTLTKLHKALSSVSTKFDTCTHNREI